MKNEFTRAMAALLIIGGARENGINDAEALLEAAGYDERERRAAFMSFAAMEQAAEARERAR